MGRILITGGTGFVGRELIAQLLLRKVKEVIAPARTPDQLPAGVTAVLVNAINDQTDWSSALTGVNVVVHSAARVHQVTDRVEDPLADYRRVNVGGTLKLARVAARAGVSRFVFLSSVKVNGEATLPDVPCSADDSPAPQDPYGISKWEAEQGLQKIARETGMEVVIIRPPLVYGPGVKGNFASMIGLVEKGVPLPLGAIHNRRSLISLGNLVDLIITCIDHPAAANQIFLAADGEDLSTSDLLRRVAAAMGTPSRLIPVPAGLLQLGATILGKQAMAQRLLGSLQVDISKTREVLGWAPPLSVDEGLRRCFAGTQDG